MIQPYKDNVLKRLKRAKGQIDGIIKMIDDDKYCMDVMTQVLALQGSLKGAMPVILESHLHTCGADHLASNDKAKKDKFISELIKVINMSSR